MRKVIIEGAENAFDIEMKLHHKPVLPETICCIKCGSAYEDHEWWEKCEQCGMIYPGDREHKCPK